MWENEYYVIIFKAHNYPTHFIKLWSHVTHSMVPISSNYETAAVFGPPREAGKLYMPYNTSK